MVVLDLAGTSTLLKATNCSLGEGRDLLDQVT